MTDHDALRDVISCDDARIRALEMVEVTWPDGSTALLRYSSEAGWDFIERCPRCDADGHHAVMITPPPETCLLEVFELESGSPGTGRPKEHQLSADQRASPKPPRAERWHDGNRTPSIPSSLPKERIGKPGPRYE